MKLIHAADIHLGRRRLDGRLPDTDFRAAFDRIADAAIRESAEVVLLAGDLFDQPQVEPPHLRQALEVLGRLKAAGIPVLAIEGNHDRGFVHANHPTWLDYLADDDLLRLLTLRFDTEGPQLRPWDPATRRGSFLDLAGVRFVGAGYLGAATPHKLRQIVTRLEPDRCHVLLLHAGPDYFVGEGGGFSKADLDAIRARVCYLALGHIHKPMRHGDWACNPGSPEHCDLQEARYDRDRTGQPVPRGYAVVEIDPAQRTAPIALEVRSLPRRPVYEVTVEASPFGNKLRNGAEALARAAADAIRATGAGSDSAVLLRLTGRLNFRRVALDPATLAQQVEAMSGVAAVAADLSALNLDPEAAVAGTAVPALSREELERQTLRSLVDNENLWGLDGEQAAVAGLFLELKEMVRLGTDPEKIAERIGADPLVDKIARAVATRDADASGPPPTATPDPAPPQPNPEVLS